MLVTSLGWSLRPAIERSTPSLSAVVTCRGRSCSLGSQQVAHSRCRQGTPMQLVNPASARGRCRHRPGKVIDTPRLMFSAAACFVSGRSCARRSSLALNRRLAERPSKIVSSVSAPIFACSGLHVGRLVCVTPLPRRDRNIGSSPCELGFPQRDLMGWTSNCSAAEPVFDRPDGGKRHLALTPVWFRRGRLLMVSP